MLKIYFVILLVDYKKKSFLVILTHYQTDFEWMIQYSEKQLNVQSIARHALQNC
jgi:hypothetical protein